MCGKMAAGKALAALSLFVILLQVSRADIHKTVFCYPTEQCRKDDEQVDRVSSVEECCLKSPDCQTHELKSFRTICDEDCEPCEVMSFGFKNQSFNFLETDGEENLIISIEPVCRKFAKIRLEIFPNPDCTGNLSDTTMDISPAIQHFEINENSGPTNFTITIKDDEILEGDETFCVNFTIIEEDSNGLVDFRNSPAKITIMDDERLEIGFKKRAYSVYEGGDSLLIRVEVKSDILSEIPIEFSVSFIEGKADESSDYSLLGTVERMPTGQMIAGYYVLLVIDDNVLEDTENFTLQLQTDQSGVDISSEFSRTVVTIYDDDTLEIGFSDKTYNVSERDGYLFFKVEIKDNGRSEVPIHFTVTDSEVDALRGDDYDALGTLQLMLEPGNQHVQGNVTIVNNTVAEKYQENFKLHLRTNQRNVSVKDGFGETTVTILDDDEITIGFNATNYSVLENSRSVDLTIVVRGELNRSLKVTVKTSGHSPSGEIDGVEGGRSEWDIVPLEETLSFSDNSSKTVTVQIRNDPFFEGDETFFAILSVNNSVEKGVMLSPGNTSITIVNDDTLFLRLWSETLVSESKGPIEVRVFATGIILFPVEINVFTISEPFDYYATEGEDYEPLDETVDLMSGPNSTEQMIRSMSLEIVDDLQLENYFEVIEIQMDVVKPQSSDMIILLKNQSYTAIQDNDALEIGFNSDSYSVNEGDGSLTFAVVSNGSSEIPIKFTVSDTQGSAIRGKDYEQLENVPQELMPLSRSFQDSVTILNDNKTEQIEKFSLHLKSNQGQVFVNSGRNTAVVTITDDDGDADDDEKTTVLTVNDTVFSNGVMTVPINVPEFGSDLHLCYQIRGKPDKYFNFVSDECASVNAHYGGVPGVSFLTIMDSISIVAIDNLGNCHRINVDAVGCLATFDEEAQVLHLVYEENGISVHSYTSRVRISVPNCEDNTLVMWVICHNQSFSNPFTNSRTEPIDVIKFEVARGLDLNESSHGLLGQFWNIPVAVTKYEGPKNTLHHPNQEYYVVNVTHPSSPPRTFVGDMQEESWKSEPNQCIFVGSSQGGPTGEVAEADDSVIEGSYKDYITASPFGTDFKYAVFDDALCSSG